MKLLKNETYAILYQTIAQAKEMVCLYQLIAPFGGSRLPTGKPYRPNWQK